MRYPRELGLPCPAGLRSIRVHDLKHTFEYRLRAADLAFENRQSLLGHTAAQITTHYSAADISTLISCAKRVCNLASRKSPALSIVRSARRVQALENAGGKRGTRTLDPGIMSREDGCSLDAVSTVRVEYNVGQNPYCYPQP